MTDNGGQTTFKSGREYIIYCGEIVRGKGNFILTPELINNYQKIWNYLFRPEESIRNGIYPNRGLWIGGEVGNGKSTALKVMQQMIVNADNLPNHSGFRIIPYLEFEKMYAANPEDLFERFGRKSNVTLAIDEVLYKDDKVRADYKMPINLLQEFIHERCDAFADYGIKTHFTSNYNLETAIDIERGKLDVRSQDRLQEMFNSIKWQGDSLRGKLELMKGGYNG